MKYKNLLMPIIILFFLYTLVIFYSENYKVIEPSKNSVGKNAKKAKSETTDTSLTMNRIIQ